MQVKCTLTGHEMPMKPDIVQAYAGSRRYSRLLSWYTSPYCEKYKHFLVDCNNKKRKYAIFFFFKDVLYLFSGFM